MHPQKKYAMLESIPIIDCMRILIVEDDLAIQDFLKKALEAESFAVDATADGEKGSYLARTNDYDVVLLDNTLPKKMGIDICRDIRNAQKTMPILMLSATDTIPQKVLLLREGVDDYMTKPFSFEELLARIQAILRRPTLVHAPTITVADVSLNLNTQEVVKGTKNIYFTRKEFALFEYLMRNKGSIISRGMIMEHVWDHEGDPFSNTIEAHIRNIRKKISSRNKPLIHNIPGRGYKIDVKK